MKQKVPILILSKIKGNLKKSIKIKKLLKNLGLNSINNFILINNYNFKTIKKIEYLIQIKIK